MSLGEKIREQRKQAGLSQEQLAEKLNVSRQAITKWETDKGIPDVANLIAISDETVQETAENGEGISCSEN